MALTAAQKQKKYRERMRADNPDKYEIAKKKNAERNKKRKKIGDCCEEEKEKERKKWRDRKKRKKAKTCNKASTSTNEINENSYEIDDVNVVKKAKLAERRKNQRHWALERKKFQDKIKELQKTITALRKKVNRCEKFLADMKKHDMEIFLEPSYVVPNETTSKNLTPVIKSECFVEKNLHDIPAEVKETVKKQLLNHNILLDQGISEFRDDLSKYKIY